MGWLLSLKPRQRLQLSLTMGTAGTEDMVDTVLEDTGDTMASERLRLSLTTDTVDTEATVLATGGATMASVRLRLSPTTATVDTVATVVATTASVRPRLSPTMAMEDMVDIVLVDTEATEATVMAMASNMFPNCSNVSYFAQ